VLDKILKNRRVQLVVNRLTLALGDDQAGTAEYCKMPGDRGPAGLKLVSDLARGSRARSQEVENLSACFVGQRTEDSVWRPSLLFHN
jgi:hypothetical protein